MPQFYATDNLQCWFQVLVEEHADSLEYDEFDDERIEFIQRVLKNTDTLTQFCEESLEMMIDNPKVTAAPKRSPFVQALLNTVDWDEILHNLRNELEYEDADAIEELQERKKALKMRDFCVTADGMIYIGMPSSPEPCCPLDDPCSRHHHDVLEYTSVSK